jgi:hypothetical protein
MAENAGPRRHGPYACGPPLGQELTRAARPAVKEPIGFDGVVYRSRTRLLGWHAGQRTGYSFESRRYSVNVVPMDSRMRLEARSYSIVKTG